METDSKETNSSAVQPSSHGPRDSFSVEQAAKVVRLYEQGISAPIIAIRMNCSVRKVRYTLARALTATDPSAAPQTTSEDIFNSTTTRYHKNNRSTGKR